MHGAAESSRQVWATEGHVNQGYRVETPISQENKNENREPRSELIGKEKTAAITQSRRLDPVAQQLYPHHHTDRLLEPMVQKQLRPGSLTGTILSFTSKALGIMDFCLP